VISRHVALVAGALALCAAEANATYSMVGADITTREVGGAGTSCLAGGDVAIIYGSVPGVGAIHAQAQYHQNGRAYGVELLGQGLAPADIVVALTSDAFDANSRVRQYGVVDAAGRTAGFTGEGTRAFAADLQGSSERFAYSVQGNILTSEAVLRQAAAAFEASGCDLAERLMRALEAGAHNGEGDSRCTPDGIPSDSSFIQVERPATARGAYLELHVRSSGSQNPIPPLREQFDAWRASHPCPAPPGGGTAGAAGRGAGGAEPPGSRSADDGGSEGCGCRTGSPPRVASAVLTFGVLGLLGICRRAAAAAS
jgi:uncharacterized Ntn-hydrolase superfamily protein